MSEILVRYEDIKINTNVRVLKVCMPHAKKIHLIYQNMKNDFISEYNGSYIGPSLISKIGYDIDIIGNFDDTPEISDDDRAAVVDFLAAVLKSCLESDGCDRLYIRNEDEFLCMYIINKELEEFNKMIAAMSRNIKL